MSTQDNSIDDVVARLQDQVEQACAKIDRLQAANDDWYRAAKKALTGESWHDLHRLTVGTEARRALEGK